MDKSLFGDIFPICNFKKSALNPFHRYKLGKSKSLHFSPKFVIISFTLFRSKTGKICRRKKNQNDENGATQGESKDVFRY